MKIYDLVKKAVDKLKPQYPEIKMVCSNDKPHKEVAKFMNACDAFILASDWEGFPVSVREAMACYLPIVSVDVGDVKQIISHTQGCFICKQDARDIAEPVFLESPEYM